MNPEKKIVLACWHSHRGGSDVLVNSLKTLKNRGVNITDVFLLCQDDRVSVSNADVNAALKKIILPLPDPTDHKKIYEQVYQRFLPEIKSFEDLHIDISPGTPAMHAVWLILHAGGELPVGSKLWSSQKNPETKRSSISLIDFPINSYLSKINTSQERKRRLAVYHTNPASEKRKIMMEDVKKMALLKNVPLLILGEKGTGKTRFVETILRELKQKKVITIPCSGAHELQLQKLLWGCNHYPKADSDKKIVSEGLLCLADQEILFLDDIEGLPRRIQSEIAAVFRNTDFKHRPLGGTEEVSTNFSVITTTGLPLPDLAKKLHHDFFCFITSFIIFIPPLRECREDIATDWQMVWDEVREAAFPEDAPMNEKLSRFLHTESFTNNFYDLKKLAYLLMAKWINNADRTIEAALTEYSRMKQVITYKYPEIKPLDADLTREEQLKLFKKRIALQGKEKYKTWLKAAEVLECDEKTLRQDAAQPD